MVVERLRVEFWGGELVDEWSLLKERERRYVHETPRRWWRRDGRV
jgi:hypothetical protein